MAPPLTVRVKPQNVSPLILLNVSLSTEDWGGADEEESEHL
jgi:hypothetical protein